MKVFFILFLFLSSMVVLSSCLKDTPYWDVSHSQPIIEFGLSPAQGQTGPFAFAPDSVGGPASDMDTSVAVVVASPQVLSSQVTTTVKFDATQISAFNTANATSFTALPDSLYSLTVTGTVAPGFRVGKIAVVLHLSKFPAHHTYALPLAIVSASTTSGQSLVVSGNSGTFMWLFQR